MRWVYLVVCSFLLLIPFALANERYEYERARVTERLTSAPVCQDAADVIFATLSQLENMSRAGAEQTAEFRSLNQSLTSKRREFFACVSQSRRAEAGYEFAASPVVSLAQSGERLITLDRQGHVFIWNLITGQASQFSHEYGRIRNIDISANAQHILLGAGSRTYVHDIFNVEEPQLLALRDASFAKRSIVGIARDGQSLAVYTSPTGQWQLTHTWRVQRIRTLSVDSSGRWAWTGAELVDLATGEPKTLTPTPRPDQIVVFSQAGAHAYVSARGGVIRRYDTATGQVDREWQLAQDNYAIPVPAVAKNGRWLAARYPSEVIIVDTSNGAQAARFTSDKRTNASVFVNNTLVIAGETGASTLLSPQTGTVTGRLVTFQSGHWAVLGANGHYDAALAGDISELRWQAQQRDIQLSQLKERYWSPGLLNQVLQHTTTSAEPPPDALPPNVSIDKLDLHDVRIALEDSGDGIGQIRVLVNDKELPLTRQIESGPNTLTIPNDRIVPGEENTIEVIAWDGEDRIASRGSRVTWHDERARAANPRLRALVVGVSDYNGRDIDLRYAANDALTFAKALELGANRLFGTEEVHIDVLTDGQAHKPAIRAAFQNLRTAAANDILVIYFAGHGVNRDDEYFYLTHTARDLNDFKRDQAVSSGELISWIRDLAVTKQVMVLDTCAAGALQGELLAARGISGDQIRAIERLKDRTGFHVLMGSSANRYSYEAHEYGQGLLTYALLEGMRGSALRDAKYVDVSRLFQHALDRVPQLARNLGGIQRPILAAPRADSFDIGLLNESDRKRIPLAQAKPVITRPTFIDASSGYDRIALADGVVRMLEARNMATEPSFIIARGSVPNALTLSGSYVIQGQQIVLQLTLLSDQNPIESRELQLAYDAHNHTNLVKAVTDISISLLTRHVTQGPDG